MTMTAGDARRVARSAMFPSVPVTTRWLAVRPRSMTAAGVARSRPAAMSRAVMTGSVAMPIRITSVSTAVARRSQSMPPAALSGSSWPVTTANDDARPR